MRQSDGYRGGARLTTMVSVGMRIQQAGATTAPADNAMTANTRITRIFTTTGPFDCNAAASLPRIMKCATGRKYA